MEKKKYISKGKDLKPYLIAISTPLAIFSVYIGFRIYSTDKILIPISVFALLAGLIFQYRRISSNWSTVLFTALLSFDFSFLAFLPGKHEIGYNFESHIEEWPYAFIIIFIIVAIGFAGDKIIPKLTEGITLLQSMAIVYWVIDLGFMNTNYVVIKIMMLIGFCFASFSIYNAFSYQVLSNTSRLILSIWSSIIMVLFASNNIYSVYQNQQIENTHDIVQSIYIGLQFFLLGVSSIYIVENYFMLAEFLPGRGKFFNDEYFEDLKKLKQQHIARYSTDQVTRLNAFLCIIFAGTIFALNYHYKFVPRNSLIWMVFLLFPIGLSLIRSTLSPLFPVFNPLKNTPSELIKVVEEKNNEH